MAGKHFVGTDYADFTNNGQSRPVSRVTLMVDSETSVTAGDDSGQEMRTECPFATQEIADRLLAKMKGYRFQMFSAGAARLDPIAELGDAVDINGVYAIISHRADDGSMFPDISAVGEAELENEYPTEGPVTQYFNLRIAKTRTMITKTASQIRLEVADLTSEMAASFVTELTAITGRVDGLNGQFSEFKNTVDGFTVTGPDGTSRLKGSSIETGSIAVGAIRADQINLTGAITFFDLNESVYNRIVSGITEDIAHTLIKDDLVESPTIRGANIYGGKFWSEKGGAYIKVEGETDSSRRSPPWFGLYAPGDTHSLFNVYYDGYGQIYMAGYNQKNFIRVYGDSSGASSYPQGTWDFSEATVKNLHATFA